MIMCRVYRYIASKVKFWYWPITTFGKNWKLVVSKQYGCCWVAVVWGKCFFSYDWMSLTIIFLSIIRNKWWPIGHRRWHVGMSVVNYCLSYLTPGTLNHSLFKPRFFIEYLKQIFNLQVSITCKEAYTPLAGNGLCEMLGGQFKGHWILITNINSLRKMHHTLQHFFKHQRQ